MPTAKKNEVTTETERPTLPVTDDGEFAMLMDTAKFEHTWRIAEGFSRSTMVPESFQKQPANCFVALQMALRLGVDPFMFLQSCYIVHGKPGIEAKLAIALANKSGLFTGPITYKLEGEKMNRSCTAEAIIKVTGELVSATCTMQIAKDEGWIDKKGSKWKTMPDLMLQYRSAMFLLRLHCPEVLLGCQSREELEDLPPETVEATEVRRLSDLTEQVQQEMQGNEQPHIDEADFQEMLGRYKLDLVGALSTQACLSFYDEFSRYLEERMADDKGLLQETLAEAKQLCDKRCLELVEQDEADEKTQGELV